MEEEHYEVFLNFHGDDARQNLVDALYNAMEDEEIRPFRDSEGLQSGDHIQKLFGHIEDCRIYIAIFSKNYAKRKWPLKELAHMVDQEKDPSRGKRIVPIFFGVTPDNVKLKEKDGYIRDLANMVKDYGLVKVKRWGNALKYVGGISGKAVGDQGFTTFSKSIAREVLSHLYQKAVPHRLVEMRDQVEEVVDLLEIESGGVLFLAIHGRDGIGKTTLAKLVYDRLSSSFDCCSFLEEIEEASKDHAAGDEKWMEARYHDKKVLLVFDDVYAWEQIKRCSGDCIYASGSRIIITASKESILLLQQEPVLGIAKYKNFQMREMEYKNALELFSWHAFGRRTPHEKYAGKSGEAVRTLAYLPLGLEILGSFLHRRPIEEWKSTVKELKNIDHASRLQCMLEIIYLELSKDEDAQSIFLDIACFFVNKEKTNPIYMWKGSENDRIWVLLNLCLVKIIHGNKLWMHSLLKDFGRKKVLSECYNYIERSRFWEHKAAFDVLKSEQKQKKAQAIRLSNDRYSSVSFTFGSNEFKGLDRLRFLELYRSNFTCCLKDLLSDLKWLSLHQSPAELIATDFFVGGLTVLNLSRSSITDRWEGWQQTEECEFLKVLNLTGCENLERTPEFSKFLALERLILEDCIKLREIDISICHLKSLEHLNVKGCDSLGSLPLKVGELTKLKEILISKKPKDNADRFELPQNIDGLNALITLEIANVSIHDLPLFPEPNQLERLSLIGCQGMVKLPESIGTLLSLIELDISRAAFTQFPNSIGRLNKLKVIRMEKSHIRTLPSAIGSLSSLEELLAKESHLTGQCPQEIGALSSLRILNLSHTRIRVVHPDICKLPKLEILDLESCDGISNLPSLPTSLKSLRLTSISLQHVHDLSGLTNLVDLVLAKVGTDHIADWIGGLNQLKNLEFSHPYITALPETFSYFGNLKSLTLCCPCIELLPQLPPSLLMLSFRTNRGQVNANMSNLTNLSILKLYQCKDVKELGVRELENLVYFSAEECTFSMPIASSLSSSLRSFYLRDSNIPMQELDLSNLNKLKQLKILDCQSLLMIRGFEKLTSIEELIIRECNLLTSLRGLASWKLWKVIELVDCGNLQDTDIDYKKPDIKRLHIFGCKLKEQLRQYGS